MLSLEANSVISMASLPPLVSGRVMIRRTTRNIALEHGLSKIMIRDNI
jgi:hypothetical protein